MTEQCTAIIHTAGGAIRCNNLAVGDTAACEWHRGQAYREAEAAPATQPQRWTSTDPEHLYAVRHVIYSLAGHLAADTRAALRADLLAAGQPDFALAMNESGELPVIRIPGEIANRVENAGIYLARRTIMASARRPTLDMIRRDIDTRREVWLDSWHSAIYAEYRKRDLVYPTRK